MQKVSYVAVTANIPSKDSQHGKQRRNNNHSKLSKPCKHSQHSLHGKLSNHTKHSKQIWHFSTKDASYYIQKLDWTLKVQCEGLLKGL